MSKEIKFRCGLDEIIAHLPSVSEERQRAMDKARAAAEEAEAVEAKYGETSLKSRMAWAAAKPALDAAKALCPRD